jgi:hypothetical protein
LAADVMAENPGYCSSLLDKVGDTSFPCTCHAMTVRTQLAVAVSCVHLATLCTDGEQWSWL